MEQNEFDVNKDFLQFKGEQVIIGLRNDEEYEGKLVSIDNYLNSIIETENGELLALKGGEVNFVSLKES